VIFCSPAFFKSECLLYTGWLVSFLANQGYLFNLFFFAFNGLSNIEAYDPDEIPLQFLG
jgi:hypothetical protein